VYRGIRIQLVDLWQSRQWVDDACAAALEMQAYDYRFVRVYLERRSEPPISLRQVDPLIRQLTLYRDLIEERAQPN
jgi:hypothetical protein